MVRSVVAVEEVGHGALGDSGFGAGALGEPPEGCALRLSERLLGLLAVLCTLTAGAAVHSGPASASVVHPAKLPLVDANCAAPGRVKPAQIVLACGDGNVVAEGLKWRTWGTRSARGTGDLSQNDCTPDCADGAFQNFPARFVLSDTVSADGLAYFTRLAIRFSGKEPAGRREEMVWDCSAASQGGGLPACPLAGGP